MDDGKTNEENHVEKVPILNKIFEGLISNRWYTLVSHRIVKLIGFYPLS